VRAHFIRGENPKRTMDIGSAYLEKQKIRSLDWAVSEEWLEEILSTKEYSLIKYKGIDVLLAYSEGLKKWIALTTINIKYRDDNFGTMREGKLRSEWISSKEKALKNIQKRLDRKFKNIKESQNFERGKDPMDAMELGDVRGRNLNNITTILVDHFRKLFPQRQTIGEYRREVNVGMGNRQDLETDQTIIYTQYGGYVFNLIWTGNPRNTKVPQRFEAKWQKMPRGPEDGGTYLVLNGALAQLAQWIKQI
jgi:hypothetical protein